MSFYLQDGFFSGVPSLLLSAGKQYLFSPGEGGRLLLREGTGSVWQEPRTLPVSQNEFAAVLDKDHLPHLVLNAQGDFYHLKDPGRGMKETPAPFYREKNKQCLRFLMAAGRQGDLHLIYLAVDNTAKRWWLLHHRYTGCTWEEPQVVDFGPGGRDNHSALAIDDRDCLHLLYRINSAGQAGLYYRQFDTEKAIWSKADPISTSPGTAFPSLATDRDRNLHLLWSTAIGEEYYIHYRFRGGPGWKSRGWTPETAISPAMAEPPFPFFSYHSGELIAAWLIDSTQYRYRFSGDQWDRIAEQRYEKTQLLRCSSFSLEGAPLNYWLAVESSKPEEGNLQIALLPAVDYDDLEGDFSKLHRYSGRIIGRIEELSTDKEQLEAEVRSKRREMLLFSRQSDQQMRLLRESLKGKETELQKMQQDLAQIIDNLKKKIEQGRQTREAERKRFQSAQQEHNLRFRRLENTLQEKEKTIARLEAREREQLALIEQFHQKNRAPSGTGTGKSGFKKLWELLFPHR